MNSQTVRFFLQSSFSYAQIIILSFSLFKRLTTIYLTLIEPKHRGFAFVTYTSAADAADAIDNMDMNELRGRVLRVNLARPQKTPVSGMGNRASVFSFFAFMCCVVWLLNISLARSLGIRRMASTICQASCTEWWCWISRNCTC